MSRYRRTWSPVTSLGCVGMAFGLVTIVCAGLNTGTSWLGGSMLMLGLLAVVTRFMPGQRGIDTEGRRQIASDKSASCAATKIEIDDARTPQADSMDTRCISASDFLTPPFCELTACFKTWFEQLDAGESHWPAFDRWVRDTLYQYFRAGRVRCFKLTESGHHLISLSTDDEGSFGIDSRLPNLVHHVITTGRRYVRGAPGTGEMVEQLAGEWSCGTRPGDSSPVFRENAPDWLLPIRHNGKTIGLIVCGELPDSTLCDWAIVQSAGHGLEMFWCHVDQAEALAHAVRTDQASGVLNRIDLTAQADKVLHESQIEYEPVVVLALSVEGARRMDDEGRWELRDWMMKQIGLVMRKKLRSDDLIGRFSDDRFVAVLRRVDIALADLIARKILTSVRSALAEESALDHVVTLRCGLANDLGDEFDTVLSRAFDSLHQARTSQKDVVLYSNGSGSKAMLTGEATS